MSGDRYVIQDQSAVYFLTLTVVNWIDIFTRPVYKDIITDSLNYCIKEKGLTVHAWVIMTNHIHLVAHVNSKIGMSGFLRDFKKFTSKSILTEIQSINESRREWLLDKFSFEARRTGRAPNYKLWTDDNHAIDITNNGIDIWSKIHYIHENPVRNAIVRNPEDFIYSSASDYAEIKGAVDVEVI